MVSGEGAGEGEGEGEGESEGEGEWEGCGLAMLGWTRVSHDWASRALSGVAGASIRRRA